MQNAYCNICNKFHPTNMASSLECNHHCFRSCYPPPKATVAAAPSAPLFQITPPAVLSPPKAATTTNKPLFQVTTMKTTAPNVGTSTGNGSTIDSSSSSSSSTKQASSSSPNPVDFGKLRVLIAEDNLVNQKVLAKNLKCIGMKDITIVDNGQKAVDAVADNNGDSNNNSNSPYDIIFMDMQMPILDGIGATKQIVQMKKEKGNNKFHFLLKR